MVIGRVRLKISAASDRPAMGLSVAVVRLRLHSKFGGIAEGEISRSVAPSAAREI